MELELADVTWKLKNCKSECGDEELVRWPLVHPLTAGSNEAMHGLAGHLLAAWKWTLAAHKVPTCPPTVLHFDQFLDEAQTGGRLE